MLPEMLTNVDEALANLPQDAEGWQAQEDSEEAFYEQWCKTNGNDFDPFRDNLYDVPKIPFGPYFISLAEINGGMTPTGAFRLYQVLSLIPHGYSYHGEIPAQNIQQYDHLGAMALEIAAYDPDGKLMEGYICIAVKKSLLRESLGESSFL